MFFAADSVNSTWFKFAFNCVAWISCGQYLQLADLQLYILAVQQDGRHGANYKYPKKMGNWWL